MIEPPPLTRPGLLSPTPSSPTSDFPFFSTEIYSVLAGQDRLERETIRASLSLCNPIERDATASGERSSRISAYYQQALNLARELDDARHEIAALGSLGRAYTDLGNYSQAIEYHQQHLTLARSLANRRGEAVALGNLGLTEQALGNYAKAIDYYQQQLTIARAIRDRVGESNALGNLGNAYKALGDYVEAIDYHQQTLTMKRSRSLNYLTPQPSSVTKQLNPALCNNCLFSSSEFSVSSVVYSFPKNQIEPLKIINNE